MACTGNINQPTCGGHVNSCPAHSGYIPARSIVFTNTIAETGEIIDFEDELNELRDQLNQEATRRAAIGPYSTITTFDDPVDVVEVRALRDLYVSLTGNPANSPISDAEIAQGVVIAPLTVQTMKDGIVADTGTCVCQCNYACTCQCNYCTCECNYCTCQCNYCVCDCNYCTCQCDYIACACECNYACQCNCNYCTCNCNYACTCNCNYSTGGGGYSDERLKEDVTYL